MCDRYKLGDSKTTKIIIIERLVIAIEAEQVPALENANIDKFTRFQTFVQIAINYNSTGLPECLIIYDVNCQYLVLFDDRIQDLSFYLQLDPQMKIFGAVGKFHLANHVNGYFSKWSLNLMKGAGHIEGEIMETLWSGMNKVSGAARLMSKAHRQKILDDYMRDANWKKTVGIGIRFYYKSSMILFAFYFIILVPTLLTKHERSQVGLDSTQPVFEQLTNTCLQ